MWKNNLNFGKTYNLKLKLEIVQFLERWSRLHYVENSNIKCNLPPLLFFHPYPWFENIHNLLVWFWYLKFRYGRFGFSIYILKSKISNCYLSIHSLALLDFGFPPSLYTLLVKVLIVQDLEPLLIQYLMNTNLLTA